MAKHERGTRKKARNFEQRGSHVEEPEVAGRAHRAYAEEHRRGGRGVARVAQPPRRRKPRIAMKPVELAEAAPISETAKRAADQAAARAARTIAERAAQLRRPRPRPGTQPPVRERRPVETPETPDQGLLPFPLPSLRDAVGFTVSLPRRAVDFATRPLRRWASRWKPA